MLDMRSATSTGRLAARVAVVLGVVALTVGVTYGEDRHSDADAAAIQPAPDLTALMDPGHGQSYALAFGDSYFVGSEHVTQAQTFGRIALNDLGYSVAIRGHGATGYVTGSRIDGWPNYVSQIVDNSISDLPDEPIKVILLEGGINDALVDVRPSLVQINAAWVMKALRATYPFATAVVLGVTPDVTGTLSGKRLAITEAIQRAATATGWTFVDTRDLITPRDVGKIIGPDLLHPTAAGHQLMSNTLRQSLIDAGVRAIESPALASPLTVR